MKTSEVLTFHDFVCGDVSRPTDISSPNTSNVIILLGLSQVLLLGHCKVGLCLDENKDKNLAIRHFIYAY
jgi:hypothetical protein